MSAWMSSLHLARRSTGQCVHFYRSAEGVIILEDATRQETFDNVPNWIEEIEQ